MIVGYQLPCESLLLEFIKALEIIIESQSLNFMNY